MGGPRPIWWRPGARRAQPRTIDELLDRVVVSPCGCWLWAGGDDGDGGGGRGYGRILRPGTRNAMAAHRYVYEVFVGPIPPGHDVDHLCARWSPVPEINRRCVRPEHLEAVPKLVNQARRIAARAPMMCEPVDDYDPLEERWVKRA